MGNGAGKPVVEEPKSQDPPLSHVIESLNKTITDLSSRVRQLEQENSAYKQQFSSLESKTGADEEKIQKTSEKISELASTIQDLKKAQELNLKTLESQVKHVETIVASQQMQSPCPEPASPLSLLKPEEVVPSNVPEEALELLPQSRFPEQDFRSKTKLSIKGQRQDAIGNNEQEHIENRLEQPMALESVGYNDLNSTRKFPFKPETTLHGSPMRPDGQLGPRQGFV